MLPRIGSLLRLLPIARTLSSPNRKLWDNSGPVYPVRRHLENDVMWRIDAPENKGFGDDWLLPIGRTAFFTADSADAIVSENTFKASQLQVVPFVNPGSAHHLARCTHANIEILASAVAS